ncbi:hypothetical protein EDD18DRAFT_1112977 [Armillaria luteobubalina]|uniref:Uncharacterized protein n=1 Tax=Armillaria luteobubalina TaxID=153913 RepID=A0AA39PDU7_9AGAR|nr:hypothetical protein EDD18DRAFT_1112977 [Armillaria luteobubalina]
MGGEMKDHKTQDVYASFDGWRPGLVTIRELFGRGIPVSEKDVIFNTNIALQGIQIRQRVPAHYVGVRVPDGNAVSAPVIPLPNVQTCLGITHQGPNNTGDVRSMPFHKHIADSVDSRCSDGDSAADSGSFAVKDALVRRHRGRGLEAASALSEDFDNKSGLNQRYCGDSTERSKVPENTFWNGNIKIKRPFRAIWVNVMWAKLRCRECMG